MFHESSYDTKFFAALGAIDAAYAPFAQERGLDAVELPPHPDTARIIHYAQKDRIEEELM